MRGAVRDGASQSGVGPGAAGERGALWLLRGLEENQLDITFAPPCKETCRQIGPESAGRREE